MDNTRTTITWHSLDELDDLVDSWVDDVSQAIEHNTATFVSFSDVIHVRQPAIGGGRRQLKNISILCILCDKKHCSHALRPVVG